MSGLISEYGYWFILAGCFLEGETVLILGGISAKLGYLDPSIVIATAFIGTFLGDQLYFFIGRRWGKSLLMRRPSWQLRAARVDRLLTKYDTLFILGFRFLYGPRTVSPFVVGMSGVTASRFLILNLVAALIWAVVIGGLAFAFGHALELVLDRAVVYEGYIFGGVILIGILVWGIHTFKLCIRTRRYLDGRQRPPYADTQ